MSAARPSAISRPPWRFALVVVNVAPKVAVDPGYQATVADIKDWERRHGPIPRGRRHDSIRLVEEMGRSEALHRQPFPGVSLAALKYLYLERHVLMHGHEPLDTDNTAPEFVGENWLLKHNFAQAEALQTWTRCPKAAPSSR